MMNSIQFGGISKFQSQLMSFKSRTSFDELHYEIPQDAHGYTYERIFGPYLAEATQIIIDEPYVCMTHQLENVSRFCALAMGFGMVNHIHLNTGKHFGEYTDEADDKLCVIQNYLRNREIMFTFQRDPNLHDRQIQTDSGFVIKVGRGLDIYEKPEYWHTPDAVDFNLRRCRQTNVDIYRSECFRN